MHHAGVRPDLRDSTGPNLRSASFLCALPPTHRNGSEAGRCNAIPCKDKQAPVPWLRAHIPGRQRCLIEVRGLVLLLLLCVGCASPGAQKHTISVRDSSGIRIIQVSEPNREELETWLISKEPILSILPEGEDPRALFVDPGPVRIGRSGDLTILDRGADPRLVRLDAGDKRLEEIGGRGEAPGEFRRPTGFFECPGDSVAVWDPDLNRITVFSSDGHLGRVVHLRSGFGSASLRVQHMMADGSFLGSETGFSPARSRRIGGWEPSRVFRIGPSGDEAVLLGEFPLARTEIDRRGHAVLVTLGGEGSILPLAGGFAWVRTDIGEVRSFDGDGELLEIIRFEWPRLAVRRRDWRRFVDSVSVDLKGSFPNVPVAEIHRRMMRKPRETKAPMLAAVPLFDDWDGVIWAEPFSFPWLPDRFLYRIDLREGHFARVLLPVGSRILDLREDRLALSRHDRLGQVYIDVFRLCGVSCRDEPRLGAEP